MAAPVVSREHKALGAAIRRLRESHQPRLSQEQLADKTGLHRNYIGRVERGELNLSFARIVRITRALDAPVSELMSEYERELG